VVDSLVKVSPDDMSKGILSISDGIITAANSLIAVLRYLKHLVRNGQRCRYCNISVCSCICILNSGGFWSLGKSVSPEDMVSGIESITDGIILAANLQMQKQL
jgi:hypothetical protein